METPTPELDKMLKNKQESQTIGQFLDWLQNERKEKVVLCAYRDKDAHFPSPIYTSIEKLLAEYFDVDLDKCEKERIAILKNLTK